MSGLTFWRMVYRARTNFELEPVQPWLPEYTEPPFRMYEITQNQQESKRRIARWKEEFVRVAWHPGRVLDWCFAEDDKADLSG